MTKIPRHHNNEVHDVPGVAKVGIRMQNEAHCNYLGAHLDGKNDHEIRFKFLLKQMT